MLQLLTLLRRQGFLYKAKQLGKNKSHYLEKLSEKVVSAIKILSRKISRRCAAIMLPLVLAGCVNSFHPDAFSSLLPDAFRAMPPATEGPAVRGLGSSATSESSSHELPVAKTKRTGAEAAPSLQPVLPPRSASSQEPRKPQTIPAAPARHLAAAGPPDFSYGETLLTEDAAWGGLVVITGVVTVAPQATLTIMPGTVVRFGGPDGRPAAGGSLLVQGRLAASGSKERPIIFTSRFAEPGAGDWQGIIILGSDKKNVLGDCLLEGAQVGLDASFSTVSLKNVTFTRSITGGRFQDSLVSVDGGGATGCTTGMIFADSEADLHNVAFSGSSLGLVLQRSSLYLSGGAFTGNAVAGLTAADARLKIEGSGFTANGAGMALTASQGSVSACRIVGNSDYGISIRGSRVKIYGNDILKNGTAGLKVEGGMGAAWSNSFAGNGRYDLVNVGSDDFTAVGNWWGGVSRGEIGNRIYDREVDAGRGRVLYLPVMTVKPPLNH